MVNWQVNLNHKCFQITKVDYSISIRNVRKKSVPWLEASYVYVVLYSSNPANKYMVKRSAAIKKIKASCETCSKLTIETSGRHHWLRSG